jgi:hypothetical protein
MIEDLYVENFETFMEWYSNTAPTEVPDMHEAMTIFFNLETYDLGAIL